MSSTGETKSHRLRSMPPTSKPWYLHMHYQVTNAFLEELPPMMTHFQARMPWAHRPHCDHHHVMCLHLAHNHHSPHATIYLNQALITPICPTELLWLVKLHQLTHLVSILFEKFIAPLSNGSLLWVQLMTGRVSSRKNMTKHAWIRLLKPHKMQSTSSSGRWGIMYRLGRTSLLAWINVQHWHSLKLRVPRQIGCWWGIWCEQYIVVSHFLRRDWSFMRLQEPALHLCTLTSVVMKNSPFSYLVNAILYHALWSHFNIEPKIFNCEVVIESNHVISKPFQSGGTWTATILSTVPLHSLFILFLLSHTFLCYIYIAIVSV